MKVKSKRSQLQATCLFTDREEPRNAFWKKYSQLKEEMAYESNVHVLTYYGIGGIGKSELLKKLRREMNEKLKTPRHVMVNFNDSQESRTVLASLKNLIEQEYNEKFTFPLFELGLYSYARKLGERADSPEVKKLTDNLFLRTLMPILGFIPVVSVAASVFSALDQLHSGIGTYLRNSRSELENLEDMEADELKDYLPLLFAQDLSHNLENATEPLVIFLDTYERLVNELSSVGMPLENDLWIRGEDGIIQNTANVLWVIAGREKLKWDILDPQWKGAVEQHILGNLSLTDSNWFLEQSGITDPILQKQLYDLTGGTPMYLDICAGRYRQCIHDGQTPDISKFGSSPRKLIERFVRYMDDSQKSLVYMLACLEKWDDALISTIAPQVLDNYNSIAYKRAKNLSFVLQSEDGSYYIHQTVGEVLRGSQDAAFDELKTHTAQLLVDRYTRAILMQNAFSAGYANTLQSLLRAGLLLHKDRDSFHLFYRDSIMQKLYDLANCGLADQADAVFELFWNRAAEQKDDLLYAAALREWAYLLHLEDRDVDRAEMLAKEAVERHIGLLGPEDSEVYEAKLTWAILLHHKEHYQEALTQAEQVVEHHMHTLGKDHEKTLRAMNALASTLFSLKKYARSVTILEHVLRKQQELLGEDDPATINTQHNLAIAKSGMGDENEALEMKRDALAKQIVALGPEHPDTLNEEASLATSLKELGLEEEALDHWHHIYEVRLAALGSNHLRTMKAAHQTAQILETLDRRKEAVPYRECVYLYFQKFRGERHSQTLRQRELLAFDLDYEGNEKEVLAHRQAIYNLRKEVSGTDHPNTIMAGIGVILSLDALGLYDESLTYKKEVYYASRNQHGEDHRITKQRRNSYLHALHAAGKYEEGLSLCREVFAWYLDNLGKRHSQTNLFKHYTADFLTAMNRHEEALPLRREFHQYCVARQPKMVAVAASRLHGTLVALGREEEAKQLNVPAESTSTTLEKLINQVRSLRQTDEPTDQKPAES